MILGIGYLDLSLRITMVVVPVAMYFLVLGLLNSRSRPQLLRGRRDFAVLVTALAPLFLLPAACWASRSYLAVGAAGTVLAAGALLLAPPRATWVIYNITPDEARQAVRAALRAAGLGFQERGGAFDLAGGTTIRMTALPLLRNISLRMSRPEKDLERRFERALAGRLATVPAETTPMAMALLLVATAMLIAPLVLVAPRAGEIVRIISGMLY
ncbi:MAG: hypothetical protein J7M21_02730 [Planctomycetes bacterium]|nr:hypothetical protein [Planctomycetota bacterium]